MLVCCYSLFAADADLDIIKTIQKLSKIEVRYISPSQDPYLKKIYGMLVADLKISRHFKILGVGLEPDVTDYEALAAKGVRLLVELRANQPNQINVRIHDIKSRTIKSIKDYAFDHKELYPFIAHRAATDTNALLSMPSIAWMNRLVVFSKYIKPGVTDIVVADYTLTYQKDIIKNNLLNLFPKWANQAQTEIYYTQYLREPTIIKYNVNNGSSEIITQSEGMAVVSSVSQDGKKLLLSLAPDGQADIFLYDTLKKTQERLTQYSGIDVSGHFVNHAKSMVFISDRSGQPNIYLKKLRLNAPAEQVVYYAKSNDSIATFGNKIVFVSREERDENGQSAFNLYLITLKSDHVRRLTASGVNQMPRFSQDGKAVMFVKKASQQNALGVILLDYNQSYLFPLKGINIQSFDW